MTILYKEGEGKLPDTTFTFTYLYCSMPNEPHNLNPTRTTELLIMNTPTKTTPKFGVIASIMETLPMKFLTALTKAKAANTCEIRLDALWRRLDLVLPSLASLLEQQGQPVILTLRGKAQGGGAPIDLEEQHRFWCNIPETLRDLIVEPDSKVFVDFDLDLVGYILQESRRPPLPWKSIGCSVHIHEETPQDQDLRDLKTDLEDTPAMAFLKLVTYANSATDAQRYHRILPTLDRRPLIAFAMGEEGLESRKWCMLDGSAGTFGNLGAGHSPSAKGQPSIYELLDDPRVQMALESDGPWRWKG